MATCRQASDAPLTPGTCIFGCLGLGDCAKSCPTGALALSPEGKLSHSRESCTGCGACMRACPRDIVKLSPVSEPLHVLCSAFGMTEPCCTLCGECVRVCSHHAITLGVDRPRIDRAKCDNCGRCATACPVGLIGDGRKSPFGIE